MKNKIKTALNIIAWIALIFALLFLAFGYQIYILDCMPGEVCVGGF